MEQQKLPNVTISLILSIVGILCCCMLGSGIIPAGIAYFLVGKDEKLLSANDSETYSNAGLLKTTKIITIISLVLNVLMVIRFIYVIATLGFDGIEQQMELIQHQMELGGY